MVNFTKRPRTGQPMPTEGILNNEFMALAKKFYEERFGL